VLLHGLRSGLTLGIDHLPFFTSSPSAVQRHSTDQF
jgi:hypothetical protein